MVLLPSSLRFTSFMKKFCAINSPSNMFPLLIKWQIFSPNHSLSLASNIFATSFTSFISHLKGHVISLQEKVVDGSQTNIPRESMFNLKEHVKGMTSAPPVEDYMQQQSHVKLTSRKLKKGA
ncbi:hypothetical protein CK203_105250 [Vitis vinifera]|uniref:Uncharacterized protein n=1 Tax=Vitis vinifera TaxID=29760 RepID=A0A438C5C3_VITVI|nr:hypothetical protein CK203_105250 [Vitis vinifera]